MEKRTEREIFFKQKLEEEENRTRLNRILNSQKRGKTAKGYRRKVWVIACAHAQWEKKRGVEIRYPRQRLSGKTGGAGN